MARGRFGTCRPERLVYFALYRNHDQTVVIPGYGKHISLRGGIASWISGGSALGVSSQHAARDIADFPGFQCSSGFANRHCQLTAERVGTNMHFIVIPPIFWQHRRSQAHNVSL